VIKKLVSARRRLAAGMASVLVVATVLVVTTLAEGSIQQVVPASAAPDRFSAQRALAELERFATEPRPDRPISEATVRAPGSAPVTAPVTGTRAERGPAGSDSVTCRPR
jgi:hypothetical protein